VRYIRRLVTRLLKKSLQLDILMVLIVPKMSLVVSRRLSAFSNILVLILADFIPKQATNKFESYCNSRNWYKYFAAVPESQRKQSGRIPQTLFLDTV
jgi:hypothetical protein